MQAPVIFDLVSGPLGDSVTRRLFALVAERRKLQLRELADLTAEYHGPEPDVTATRQKLDQLVQAQLVAVAPASIPDWSTYYITAKGLEVGRQLGLAT